ncbi:MAG TPA: hypothetical protein DHW39_00135 [Erysipelotrichaceae bacterium]|nr:hypothetical protein [Erysipelotrichaceae bacterium]
MNWKKSESAERPSELDTTSSKVVNYVRKNIVEKQIESEGQTATMYDYEELAVPKSDWLLFSGLSDSETRISEAEDAIIELAEIIGGGE